MQILLVGGRSGAGKSTAMQLLEDMGYYCIDNLPVGVLEPIYKQLHEENYQKYIAIGLNVRSFHKYGLTYQSMIDLLEEKTDVHLKIWYLDADDETLVIRYNKTRRKHPLSHENRPLLEALDLERDMLKPLADSATHTINTTGLNIQRLRDYIKRVLGLNHHSQLQLHVFSFGYKYGVPIRSDYIFDVRCLPNPHWYVHLRALSGLDDSVCDYFAQYPEVNQMALDIFHFTHKWLTYFKKQERSYMDIGIGCTGGQHRSVYISEKIKSYFLQKEQDVIVSHRELSKW
jgi:UPF0042 nucleotide-binding protein